MTKTADRLRELRLSLGLTQKDFAKSLGIKHTTYNGYETGNHQPKSDVLLAISQKYNVTIDYLLGKSKNPTPDDGNGAFNPTPRQKALLELVDGMDDKALDTVLDIIKNVKKLKEE